ncbi:MAG: AMP-binding protein, partial [Actinobacteria bacterium]|nr:AMP-binding protein [Actinomycetota bacterium]
MEWESEPADGLKTVLAVVDHAAARDGDRAAIHCGGRDLVIGEIRDESLRLASALIAHGVQPGDRVALMMGNVPEFLVAWFGILRAGAIEVPIHSAYRGLLLEHILSETGANVLICDADMVERL